MKLQRNTQNRYGDTKTYHHGYVWKYMELYGQARKDTEYVWKYKEIQYMCMEL